MHIVDALKENLRSFLFTSVAIAIPCLYYLYNRSIRYWTFRIENWGSVELHGHKGIRANKCIGDGPLTETLDHHTRGKGEVKTVYDCLLNGVEISLNGPCLGRIVGDHYEWLTYKEVAEKSRIIAQFLKGKGIKRQTCVGIYAASCPEWCLAQFALVFQSIVSVPLYDTLGPESLLNTVKETELSCIFSDSKERLESLLFYKNELPMLKTFILLNDNVKDATFADSCTKHGVELLTWSQASAIGQDLYGDIADDPPKPDDIFVVQYTSGTTGNSKGVMMTNRNVISQLAGFHSFPEIIHHKDSLLRHDDRVFLFLPMAHAYAQIATIWFMYAGAQVAFSSGDVNKLLLEMQLSQPTFLPLVPRIMNRVYAKICEQTQGGFKGWLFWKCYARKRELLKKGCITRNSLYDWLVFHKLQKMLGGHVRFMTTGSAPIATEVLEFWRCVFGAFLTEGYGQTESTSAATLAVDIQGGNVGHPSLCNYIKLIDVPEMNYTTANNPPQGEICIKGHNVMLGYYKQPRLTKEAFTEDGWLLTGDIGQFRSDGSLQIIDRRKNIFKLSQGEYVAPDKIEAVYAQCSLLAQVFVDGNSLQPFTVAIVVPEEQSAKSWARTNNLPEAVSLADLCLNKQFLHHVFDTLIALGKAKKLNSLEQIKSLHLHPELFSIVNGLQTPSMKNKRNELRKRFQCELEAMYREGPMVAAKRE